ncbi:MAG TPA: radical SAM protein, partial [Streptosporangiaceae bacterium]
MPSILPDGEPVPPDGALPARALDGIGGRPFGFYVHIPFCATRCGYCDFNTYTATELGGGGSQAAYAGYAAAEVSQAARALGPDRPEVETVFFGGGTPTLLASADLTGILAAIDSE